MKRHPTFWDEKRCAMVRKAAAIMADDNEGAALVSKWLGKTIARSAFCSIRDKLGIPSAADRNAAIVKGAPVAELDYEDDAETRPAVEAAKDTEPPEVDETEPPPADRTYVEKPVASRTLPPLDVGSKETERILLVPDTHRPFHDRRAWALMLKAAKAFCPHTIVQLGDFADMYTVSDHDKDPRRASQLSEEAADVNEGFDELDDLGAERKVFTAGNHCYRLERYLIRNAPAALNMLSVQAMFRLAERGWQYVPYQQHARIGKLYVTHDVGHAGVHAVHHTANAFHHNIAFGHTHRLAVTYFGSVTKERHVAASLGWLGNADEAKYIHEAKKAAWQLGFGIANMEKDGTVHLRPVPIVDYRVVMDVSSVVIAE